MILVFRSHSLLKSKFWKILVENTTIIAHEINKPWPQIPLTLHVKKELIEVYFKIESMFWNVLTFFMGY